MDETQAQPVVDGSQPALSGEARPLASDAPTMPAAQEAAQLSGILLPQEQVVYGSRPHPVVFIRPAIGALITFVAMIVTLVMRVHPIIRGHHVDVAFVSLPGGVMVAFLVGLFMLIAISKLSSAAFYYYGYRVIATNRRVFVKSGVLGRRVRPIGNAATAGAGLVQDFFGRKYDYGTIYTNFGAVRDIREPVPLYRAIQAVANGVQGDTWTPPSRHTFVP